MTDLIIYQGGILACTTASGEHHLRKTCCASPISGTAYGSFCDQQLTESEWNALPASPLACCSPNPYRLKSVGAAMAQYMGLCVDLDGDFGIKLDVKEDGTTYGYEGYVALQYATFTSWSGAADPFGSATGTGTINDAGDRFDFSGSCTDHVYMFRLPYVNDTDVCSGGQTRAAFAAYVKWNRGQAGSSIIWRDYQWQVSL